MTSNSITKKQQQQQQNPKINKNKNQKAHTKPPTIKQNKQTSKTN